MEVSIKDFVSFIHEQPPERVIHHNSWNLCAVGDYCAMVAGIEHVDRFDREESMEFCEAQVTLLELLKDTDLYEVLNNHGCFSYADHGKHDSNNMWRNTESMDSYRELQGYIDRWPHNLLPRMKLAAEGGR